MSDLHQILDTNEQVIWEGRPKFLPYFLGGALQHFWAGVVWISPTGLALYAYTLSGQMETVVIAIISGFILIGIWLLIGQPLYAVISYSFIRYAITNKRVILQRGIIGRDFQFIDFDKVTNAEVSVGFWDKAVGGSSGTITLSSAGSTILGKNDSRISLPYTLSNIDQPYERFKQLKQLMHDVKTDIEYPNQYRPTSNPGYNTKQDAQQQ